LEKQYYVYILTTKHNSALYIGITNDLQRRLYEHQNGLADGFTKKYHIHKLVFFESTSDPYVAISREKQLKGWKREKKIALVESTNPEWKDLSLEWDR